MTSVFSVEPYASAQRPSAWREAVCETFVRLDCKPRTHSPMHGRIEANSVGELHIARVQSSAQTVSRTKALANQSDQAFVLMSLQLRGHTVISQDGCVADLSPGCLGFYDTTRPYTLELPQDFDQLVLYIPHQTLERLAPAGLDQVGKTLSATNPYAQALMAISPQLLGPTATRLSSATLELMALAIESLQQEPHNQATYSSALSFCSEALFWRANEFIANHLHEVELSPASIACALHVSLRRLQEVFQANNKTVNQSIWQSRLNFARSLLLASNGRREAISHIAAKAGFRDVSHFNRRFKAHFFVTPSELRDHH
jgi:AraC-like DNA-binding protein